MTQSGQGEEPSPREAREGIVLPSDGGEPLLPGMTGGYGRTDGNGNGGPQPGYGYGYGHQAPAYGSPSGRTQEQPPSQTPGQAPGQAPGPAGGQAWGNAWGPDQHQDPAPPPGQGWQSPPDQSWSTPDQTWGTPSGTLPPESPQTYGADGYPSVAPQPNPYGPPTTDPYGSATAGQGTSLPPADPYGSTGAGTPLPPTADPYGSPASGAYGSPDAGHGGAYAALPAQGQDVSNAAPGAALPSADSYGSPDAGAHLPPAAGHGGAYAALPTQGQDSSHAAPSAALPPVVHGGGSHSAPLPPADEGVTQYIPPVVGDGAARYPGSAPAPAGDEGATQYIPPVGPGALPPEVHVESPGESTQFLGRARHGGGPRAAAGPMPPAAGPDAEATQYIPPVPGQQGGDRQPPAEFDNLFRSGPGAAEPAGATQQMPRYQQPASAPGAQPPYGQSAQPPYSGPARPRAYDDGDGGRGRGGRSRSRVPVIAAVGIGIVVLGVGAGALLAGGGSDEQGDKNQTVSATAPAAEGSASPSADPAEEQAVALDKLLADSGDSRTSVISAVADVKSCKNLGQAAKDLRDAAQQRADLVTRLSGLTVDKLPDNAALTEALTKAWKASASADNHYAAWADQAAAKKGCKKGQARVTGQTAAGNKASGTASTEKTEAARLWNAIAKTYGLTQRQPTQL